MQMIFWLSLAVLYYIYDGYGRLLAGLAYLAGEPEQKSASPDGYTPRLTALLTVFNERDAIVERIENILACEYPEDKLELIVASDGSTDGTDELVRTYDDPRVILFQPEERTGKSDTQNQAIARASGEIISFTDAGTTFDRRFFINIVEPFSDPRVGGVTGRCLFRVSDGGISESQDHYWRYELRLRRLESRLGILAVSSGNCLAVRKHLFRPMEHIYGEDCVIPLDVVLQGRTMKYCESAIAYDTMSAETASEFKARIRMTLRNWQGTWSRDELLNPFRYPGYAFALWSHKLLRWLSPVFLLSMTASAAVLAINGNPTFQLISLGILLAYLSAGPGWWAQARGRRLPVVSKIYSFLLANAGFLVGLWRSLSGHTMRTYRN